MSRVSSIKAQISLKTIQRRLTQTTGVIQTKWKIIYYTKKKPRPAKEIADLVNKWQQAKKKKLRDEYENIDIEHNEEAIYDEIIVDDKDIIINDDNITVTTRVVQKTIAAFNKDGERTITKKNEKIRNRAYLSYKEEQFFLWPFIKYGKSPNVNELHTAYEKQFGRTVHKSTIYRMLKRHTK